MASLFGRRRNVNQARMENISSPTNHKPSDKSKSRCSKVIWRIKFTFYTLTLLGAIYIAHSVYVQVSVLTRQWTGGTGSTTLGGDVNIGGGNLFSALQHQSTPAPSGGRDAKSQQQRHAQFLRLVQLRVANKWTDVPSPEHVNGAFIHMGKTGGSTLSLLLRNGCHSFMPKPCRTVGLETAASRLVGTYYHVPDFGLISQAALANKHPFYIITLRDPLARSISAFVYEHLDNALARGETMSPIAQEANEEAKKCFPTLEAFVEAIGDTPDQYDYEFHRSQIVAENCTNLARAVVDAKVRRFNHFYFPFYKIRSFLSASDAGDVGGSQEPILFATRQEHLWYDWKKINYLLGQVGDVVTPYSGARDMSNVHQPVTRDLSPLGKERLCRALQKEYEGYVQILREAINLTDQDVQESLDEIKHNCPNVRIPE